MSEIEKLRALLEKAAPLPYREDDGHIFSGPMADDRERRIMAYLDDKSLPNPNREDDGKPSAHVVSTGQEHDRSEADAALIVAAVNALPALLDVCEAAAALRLAYNGDDAELEMFAKNRLWACLSRLKEGE